MTSLGSMPTVVCDNGTGFVKVGFAGHNFPTSIFPSMVGRPILRAEESLSDAIQIKDIMCGDEAAACRSSLEVTYPIENGIIRPQDSKILLTEPPMNPTKNREKLVETMFEKYSFGACVVVDTGDGVSHVVPVYDGYVPQHLIRRMDVAGRHVTDYLIKLLLIRGYAFNRTADFETARQIKEKLCYVTCDIDAERKLALETTCLMETFTLPDGRVIKIGRERFEAPEALFNPSLIGSEKVGMSDMVFDMIQDADMDTRPMYYQHIVLSGGSSMYPGLPTRLEKDIKDRYFKEILKGSTDRLKKFKINVEDPPRRKHMVFLGGSVLADIMKDRPEFWITRQEYAEQGLRCLAKIGKS
eukprot:gene1837-3552_t